VIHTRRYRGTSSDQDGTKLRMYRVNTVKVVMQKIAQVSVSITTFTLAVIISRIRSNAFSIFSRRFGEG
jgi:hypothetical protein